jgi:ppGpp synthetase/RelA/SpoT-type nucleotidyltranferase
LAIAQIIASIYPDTNATIASLLFFSIARTHLKSVNIKHYFNTEISDIFEALSKIFEIQSTYNCNTAQETFKLLLSLTPNIGIKILLIRFAYLLHEIIFDSKISPIKYYSISKEISEIYLPLFKEIQVEKIKTTLQNVCLRILQPKLNDYIVTHLTEQYPNQDKLVITKINAFHDILSSINIAYTISGRIKSPYSIAKKLVTKSSTAEQLFDIIGFRVIVSEETECYKILDTIHSNYQHVTKRYKNFIQFPKQNGYQSVHTVIIDQDLQKIEIQIRTKRMHDIAQLGNASHLQYKMQSIKGNNTLHIVYNTLNRYILDILNLFTNMPIVQTALRIANESVYLKPDVIGLIKQDIEILPFQYKFPYQEYVTYNATNTTNASKLTTESATILLPLLQPIATSPPEKFDNSTIEISYGQFNTSTTVTSTASSTTTSTEIEQTADRPATQPVATSPPKKLLLGCEMLCQYNAIESIDSPSSRGYLSYQPSSSNIELAADSIHTYNAGKLTTDTATILSPLLQPVATSPPEEFDNSAIERSYDQFNTNSTATSTTTSTEIEQTADRPATQPAAISPPKKLLLGCEMLYQYNTLESIDSPSSRGYLSYQPSLSNIELAADSIHTYNASEQITHSEVAILLPLLQPIATGPPEEFDDSAIETSYDQFNTNSTATSTGIERTADRPATQQVVTSIAKKLLPDHETLCQYNAIESVDSSESSSYLLYAPSLSNIELAADSIHTYNASELTTDSEAAILLPLLQPVATSPPEELDDRAIDMSYDQFNTSSTTTSTWIEQTEDSPEGDRKSELPNTNGSDSAYVSAENTPSKEDLPPINSYSAVRSVLRTVNESFSFAKKSPVNNTQSSTVGSASSVYLLYEPSLSDTNSTGIEQTEDSTARQELASSNSTEEDNSNKTLCEVSEPPSGLDSAIQTQISLLDLLGEVLEPHHN